MTITDSTELHESIEDTAEFNTLVAALQSENEEIDRAGWHHAACDECRRGDEVVTTKAMRGNLTLRRHSCARCDTHGATVIRTSYGTDPSSIWTGGDVRFFDLERDENADLRGTF